MKGTAWIAGTYRSSSIRMMSCREAATPCARMIEQSPDAEDACFRLGCLRLNLARLSRRRRGIRCLSVKRKNWPEALLNTGIA